MTKVITVHGMRLGQGRPKVCVCIAGRNEKEIQQQVSVLHLFDMIEWRADYVNPFPSLSTLQNTLTQLRQHVCNKPIIFTCRSDAEGGRCILQKATYCHVLETVIRTCDVDMIDLEIDTLGDDFQRLCVLAQQHGITVIGSYHNFTGMPSRETFCHYLHTLHQNGADIAKIAVMPQHETNVLTLLEFAEYAHSLPHSIPLVVIGMGDVGKITRIGCDVFGSPFTFCSGQISTAPGQISAERLYRLFTTLEGSTLNVPEYATLPQTQTSPSRS